MLSFTYSYIRWHYTEALRELFFHVRNLLAFLWRYFSIPHLVATLLSPWSRLHEEYASGIHLSQQAGTFVVNMMMRIVGAFVRIFFILVGVFVLCVGLALAVLSFFAWLFLPAVAVFLAVATFDRFTSLL